MRSIAIDIGNTRIKAGLFAEGTLTETVITPHHQLDALGKWLARTQVTMLIISSTASEDIVIDSFFPEGVDMLKLNSRTPLPIEINYEAETLGQDRMANAVAGHLRAPEASLVIDAGTCVTFDWTIDGSYEGGAISPGLHMRLKAMHRFTGRLPLVERPLTEVLIGKNTIESLSSGAFQGLVLEIQGVIRAFHSRYPEGKVLLTGGDGQLLANAIENDIFADPFLTLKGLHGILEFNNA